MYKLYTLCDLVHAYFMWIFIDLEGLIKINAFGSMLLKKSYVNIAVVSLFISSRGKTGSFLNNDFV